MIDRLIVRQEVRQSNIAEEQIGDLYLSGFYKVVVTLREEVKTLRVIIK